MGMKCHCYFNLHFPDWWYWSFHIFIGHVYIFLWISNYFHSFSFQATRSFFRRACVLYRYWFGGRVLIKLVKMKLLSCVQLFVTSWTVVHGILQTRILTWVAIPLSRGSSQPGIAPRSPTLQADSLPAEPQEKSPRILEWVACCFSCGSSQPRNWTWVSCIAGRFFTNWAINEALIKTKVVLKCLTIIVNLVYFLSILFLFVSCIFKFCY